jgi:hypothetical protein
VKVQRREAPDDAAGLVARCEPGLITFLPTPNKNDLATLHGLLEAGRVRLGSSFERDRCDCPSIEAVMRWAVRETALAHERNSYFFNLARSSRASSKCSLPAVIEFCA